jgi:hypothetical protein
MVNLLRAPVGASKSAESRYRQRSTSSQSCWRWIPSLRIL